ncbi:MAG: hypothetical protein R8G33_06555 [Gammaproteobacteria bacterium]|nr:hypothetical protein [Gammaproteobacteria bacterium]
MIIILIRIIAMVDNLKSEIEIIINRKDIDFDSHTVNKLKKSLITHIETVSLAVCESPETFKRAIEKGLVKIGGYQSQCGKKLIYMHFDNYDYVIPYRVDH